MSTRGRRSRGRPPKFSLPRTNLLKKPKYLMSGGNQVAHSPRVPPRGRNPREAAQRGRGFIQRVLDSDYEEDDRSTSSELEDPDANEASDSEDSENLSVYSADSLSTVSSTPSKKRIPPARRVNSPCPIWLQDRDIPPLVLPKSSDDL